MRVIQMSAASPKNSGNMPKQVNIPGQVISEIQYRTNEREKQNSDLFLKLKKIFSEFGTDDYILAGIIIVLFFEGCEDYILLCVLGYLFIMGIKT